jgi:Lon protease-like protein
MHDDLDLREFRGVGRLFPLPGVVLFPHVVLPLHIFEPRYRQMTEQALASDRLITIVQTLPGQAWGAGGEPVLESVGCLGRILNHERLPDGRFNFLLLGRKRVRLTRELAVDTLYRQAELQVMEDSAETPEAPSLQAVLLDQFRTLMSARGPIAAELDGLLRGDLPLGVLTDILSHTLDLPPALKQELLGTVQPCRRAERLATILGGLGREPRPGSYPPPISPN